MPDLESLKKVDVSRNLKKLEAKESCGGKPCSAQKGNVALLNWPYDSLGQFLQLGGNVMTIVMFFMQEFFSGKKFLA